MMILSARLDLRKKIPSITACPLYPYTNLVYLCHKDKECLLYCFKKTLLLMLILFLLSMLPSVAL